MARKFKQEHWNIARAAGEFGVDPDTLKGAIRRGGIEPAFKDKTFSTVQIVSALYGDYDSQRTRKITAEADLLEMEKRQTERTWLPAEGVARVWGKIITELRQKVTFLEISDEKRKEILEDMQTIPVDDYFATANTSPEEDSEAGA